MVNLYNLATKYVDFYNALIETADEETGEVDIDIAAALEKVQGTFEEKAIATATVFRGLGNYSTEIDVEIKRLQALKKRIDSKQKRVGDYLTQACEMTGTEKLQGMYANISFRKTEQTIIDDERLLPQEFIRVTTTYEPDKTKIREAIKRGEEVQGAHIEQIRKIQIK